VQLQNIFKQFFDSQDSNSPTHNIVENYNVLGPICITVPNFMKTGQKVAEIWRFNSFQNGCHLPLDFFEIHTFYWSQRWRDPFCTTVPNFVSIGQSVV